MIDEISLKILRILQDKARIPNVEVARQVGMAPSAVLERIRKLEKQGFIDGYEVRLNPARFQRSLVGFIRLTIDASDGHRRIEKSLAGLDAVQEVHYITGEDGYLLKVRVSDPDELNYLVRDKIGSLQGIRTTQTSIVLSTIKETARIPIDRKDMVKSIKP